MNTQEELFFAALSKDRAEIADVLERRAVRGYKDSVVEKYSDQAHFIYELLQNADDACATTARFILKEDCLIFSHNGTRLFSVSDPKHEDIDSENNTLGDINAITSIANSNKTSASIGKFGVGFKAVFQYTVTPHIYDPNFRFKIDRFIVPTLLESDFPGRRPDETLFVFPFNHPERNAEEAYSDISDKLKNLSFPLLFLTNLKGIEFEFGSVLGLYDKAVTRTITYDNTTAERVILTQNAGDELYEENLWLFSKLDECGRKYSVGFFMNKEGRLCPVKVPAFCFFPTKEVTNLYFILHAPFLLTDSRESIRAGVPHNDKMIKSLAVLAADALEYLRDIGVEQNARLIDDNIITIIPTDEDKFSKLSDKSRVSFLPFYQEIKERFENSELLPSDTGYVTSKNAYWAEYPQLAQLFSNVQLADITENQNAQWVFTSFGHYETNRNNKALCSYIDALVRANINEDIAISGRSRDSYYNRVLGIVQTLENVKGITAAFIEKQTIEWLHVFYKWVSETKHRTDIIVKKPIFLDQNGKAVAAFDEKGQNILFLPVKNIEGYTVVNEELLANKETRAFIESLGVKEPSLRDQIYNIVLPMYKRGEDIEIEPHFLMFFNYYCGCSNSEVADFINLIKGYEFLNYYTKRDNEICRGRAASMYLPTPELCTYFETCQDTKFVVLDKYKELVGHEKEQQLISFLKTLGVRTDISICMRSVHPWDEGRGDLPIPQSTRHTSWEEPSIDGCAEILEYITKNQDREKSVVLWNALLKIIEVRCNGWHSIGHLLRGSVKYFYRSHRIQYFESPIARQLKGKKWVANETGEFCIPCDLHRASLSKLYDTSSEYAEQLMDFLGVQKEEISDESGDGNGNLTDEQRAKIALADKVKAYGIENEEDLAEYMEYKRQKEERRRAAESERISPSLSDSSDIPSTNSIDEFFADDNAEEDGAVKTKDQHEKKTISKATADVIKDIARRTKANPAPVFSNTSETEDDVDGDELIPSIVDYSKKIERAKEKSAAEIDRITYYEKLYSKASRLTAESKYSLLWFQTLLELESLNSSETNSRSREISISFAKVDREPGTQRTLILRHPNQYIPQFMEDLADIPMVFHIGDKTKTVAIEVANVKSYTLRVKVKNAEDIADIDITSVTMVTIDAKSPFFLLEELRKKFDEFTFAPEYNMKNNLCENIEFIFGPPGTGKTTHLARKIILPLMKSVDDCRVLVLTPTNKSADVLARRIMEVSDNDSTYEDWLVRFGATGDEEIEQSPIFRDKTFDIRTLQKTVMITTIARFPYDFFMPQGTRIFLSGMNWDYIIIDEASMIPLANILYPLYKKTPKKFIIAGDPFQIEPITSVNLWKNENIYTMVELDSFVNPITKPYPYKVELLTTQYRSVPDIGGIFSGFTYGGILKHHRPVDSQRPLHLENKLGIKTINIIKFPVSKYESIYRCKRLNHSSSYQVYSAIFTFEYVCYLSRIIAENNPGELYRIGIIAPYRAEADIIDKLLASERLPKEIDIQVGTIHGFQGDECDIIFAVFNPPPTISASKDMFLNKNNIINVSISRAKDYLFVVMPDDNTENICNLRLVKKVEDLIKATDAWNEFETPDLETLMFGDSHYLENNAFSTSHQCVNVYGLPEKQYEIRSEDTAVDVQIHRENIQ